MNLVLREVGLGVLALLLLVGSRLLPGVMNLMWGSGADVGFDWPLSLGAPDVGVGREPGFAAAWLGGDFRALAPDAMCGLCLFFAWRRSAVAALWTVAALSIVDDVLAARPWGLSLLTWPPICAALSGIRTVISPEWPPYTLMLTLLAWMGACSLGAWLPGEVGVRYAWPWIAPPAGLVASGVTVVFALATFVGARALDGGNDRIRERHT